MTLLLTVAFYAITVGAVAWLAAVEVSERAARRRRWRQQVERCGRVTYPTPPRFDGGPRRRVDPSPPAGDYGWRAVSEGMEQT